MAAHSKLTFPPLIAFLQDRREALNAIFHRHRLQFPRLEDRLGMELITSLLEPVWQAVDGQAPEGLVMQAVQVWYDLGLELAGKGFCPGGHVTGLWPALVRLARVFPLLVVRHPRPVLTGLANALWQMQQQGPTVSERWLGIMETLAGQELDLPLWMQAGMVAAWRCGMAHLRKPALDAAAKLSPRVGAGCLRLNREVEQAQWVELINAMTIDPWYDPETGKTWKQEAPSLIGSVGSFRGLNGFFTRPPLVRSWHHSLIAGFDQDWFVIHADLFGCGLQRIRVEIPDDRSPLPELWKLQGGGIVVRGGCQAVIPELGGCSGAAANQHVMAVTLHHSHRIFLVA